MKSKMKTLRIFTALAVLVAAVALAHSGGAFDGAAAWGTLCVLCPVGFAQIAAASGSIPWHLLPGIVAALAIVFVIGRAFCSWLCPSQLLKNVFGGHKPRGIRGRSGVVPARRGCTACASSKSEGGLFAQGIVLVVLLAVSFIVRFPVFCLLCPIGLVFGTLWAINRVFVLLQPGWELVIFPLMLLVELFAFKRWCSSICPLGFFFGLVGKLRMKLGFGARPVADCKTCISREGCRVCSTACPEDIDVARSAEAAKLEECSFCLDCVENCPTKSIHVRMRAAVDAANAETAEESIVEMESEKAE